MLSVKGDVHVNQRREKAYQHLEGGRITAILRNLLFAIEDEAAEMIDFYKENHKNALTPRTRAFLEKRFGISDLTENQKKAVEIALNTPDIAVIQGPQVLVNRQSLQSYATDCLKKQKRKQKRRRTRIVMTHQSLF